ncbi:MAG: acyl carrier protein [Candidatus Rokubacteria bacterium]|nr:acyl carrier protein [Candidatus Rokubacteria bacterium]
MTDARARLTRCFTAVFPQLTDDAVPTAALATVPAWDSIAHVTLLAVVEEEFGTPVDPDEIEHLTSFDALLHAVTRGAAA